MAKSKTHQRRLPEMTNPIPFLVVGLVVGVPLVVYILFLGLSAIPYFQRHFLYAHKVHTLWWKDLDEPEQWGFAKNQVTPFSIKTADNQTLYAWHVLPLPLYAQHEATLSSQPAGFSHDITTTHNFRLLRDDPTSKLIISFHGNAGHLTQGHRPSHYHSLTAHTPYHLLTIDYRGFGRSTGSPTEHGLILDAAAAVNWAVRTAGVPPSRIVLLGQSLGTAVAASAAELFTLQEEADFAGVVLVAGFSTLPQMLSGYAIAGWVPVLRPLTWWPWLLRQVIGRVADKWESADRLREVVRGVKQRGGRMRLSLVHARNDWDIPCHEDDLLFRAAVEGLAGREMDEEGFKAEKAARTVVKGKHSFVATWREGDVVVRQELFPYGGHNSILHHSPVLLAVMRSFDLVEEPSS
ncbi:Monoacylglycerol lipase ABHD12 [Madurella mycetomatis]|uniref:Monoacylglycerol lipase ABHD12 n=1 Tax=Madurella mycetomatis TaxID=100816 RepID=A0A175W6S7_9PEZI|nr:Monoacylglycerol lipase ABHD12 [Madurella mycetomatis]